MKLRHALIPICVLVGLAACATPPDPEPDCCAIPTSDPLPETTETKGAIWPDEAFRSTRPTPGPIPEFTSPTVETFALSNGLAVVLIHKPTLPVVAMDLSLPVGEGSDPATKPGLADLTARLLNQGTGKLDRVQFKERLASLGSSAWAYANTEESGFQVRSLKRNLGPSLDLWVDLLRDPGLRKDDLERVRKELIADIVQRRGDIRAVGDRLARPLLFGTKHPYGHMITEKTVAGVSLADCKKVLSTFKPDGATLFVAGDITRQEVIDLLEPRLRDWKGKVKPTKVATKTLTPAGKIFFVDVSGADQSRVIVVHAGPGRLAPDYTATFLMDRILGGSFSSRINMNLREEKGWAYGARAGHAYLKHAGWFSAQTNVDSPHTGEAVVELLAEMRKMKETSITEAEFKRERDGTILSIPARFSTIESTMGAFSGLAYFGLPWNHHDAFLADLGKIDGAAVDAAARAHLSPDGVFVVIVGDGNRVRPQLEKLVADEVMPGIQIVEIDADGAPVKKK